jgi:hypothetical protein
MATVDKRRLTDFITNVYEWLGRCYAQTSSTNDSHRWPAIKPYKDLRKIGKKAWGELVRNQPLDAFIARVEKLSEGKLKAHGLKGAQLEYKLAVIDHIVVRIRQVSTPSRLWTKLVDAIDTVLDSLISAVGAGTALKEIKDILHAQR